MEKLGVLVTAMAYMIDADNKATVEEKARLVGLLNKHVSRGELTQDQVARLTTAAFQKVKERSLDKFLDQVTKHLTPGQRLAVVLNLYDAMLVDGSVVEGERRVIEQVERAFEIDRAAVKAAREVLSVKNDTTIFTEAGHPHNEPGYRLRVFYQGE